MVLNISDMSHKLRIMAVFAFLFASSVSVGGALRQSISPVELLTRISSQNLSLILDVRTPGEFALGHVPTAINIPYTELAKRLGEIEYSKDQEVVVYCERGGRASIAEDTLHKAGFVRVRHLIGDMSSWRKAGNPIERPK